MRDLRAAAVVAAVAITLFVVVAGVAIFLSSNADYEGPETETAAAPATATPVRTVSVTSTRIVAQGTSTSRSFATIEEAEKGVGFAVPHMRDLGEWRLVLVQASKTTVTSSGAQRDAVIMIYSVGQSTNTASLQFSVIRDPDRAINLSVAGATPVDIGGSSGYLTHVSPLMTQVYWRVNDLLITAILNATQAASTRPSDDELLTHLRSTR